MTIELRKAGPALVTFAVLFAILAISNLLKPLRAGAQTGFVFFGTRTTGTANLILGPLFGAILLAYAAGILCMKRYALPLAYAYASYVVLNIAAFSIMHPPKNSAQLVFGVVYTAVGVGISVAAAVALTRRRSELT